MAVNERGDVLRAVHLLAETWFSNGLRGRNRKGERVVVTASLDTPFGEVIDAIAMGGDGGNLVVFEGKAVTVLTIENTEIAPIPEGTERQPVGEEATVGMFLDTYRKTKNAEDIAFTVTRRGGVGQGIKASGFQHDLAAA